KSELEEYKHFPELNIYSAFNYNLVIKIEFDLLEVEEKIIVTLFEVNLESDIEGIQNVTRFQNSNNADFNIKTNVGVVVSKTFLLRNTEYSIKRINYSAFFPTEVEIEVSEP